MKKKTEDWRESIQKKYGKNKKFVYYVLKTFGNDKIMSNELSNLSLFKKMLECISRHTIDENLVDKFFS